MGNISEAPNYMNPPDCSCGSGKMRLFRAGPDTTYPGRFYYKCPRFMCHKGNFKWLDEFCNETTTKTPQQLFRDDTMTITLTIMLHLKLA
ncbi:hypothetical protein ACS0TY_000312 [Phlomoides rotata]